ncbi:MAG: hypothetical protein WC401_05220 [Bacteroidales bacterium]|jgi:hypothetical protein
MEGKILSYKVFKNTEEFEKWQEENAISICSVNPIAGNFDMSTSGNIADQKSSAKLEMYVFVVYFNR